MNEPKWPIAKQVIFTEEVDDGEFVKHAGIAFGDGIICACCGGIVDPEDCSQIIELPWVSFEEEMILDNEMG